MTEKTRFCVFGGKTHFYVFGGKTHCLRFWWENAFCVFDGKTRFYVFGGKMHFGRKCGFAILAEKMYFVVLAGKCFLWFWRKNAVLSFFREWQNDIKFRFVICELYTLYHFDSTISIQMVQIGSAGWTLKLSLNF